jgi:hypothetical protein
VVKELFYSRVPGGVQRKFIISVEAFRDVVVAREASTQWMVVVSLYAGSVKTEAIKNVSEKLRESEQGRAKTRTIPTDFFQTTIFATPLQFQLRRRLCPT